MNVKVGTFALNTATGNQAITGVGFQPKVVIFWFMREWSNAGNQEYEYFFGAAVSSTKGFAYSSNMCDYCDGAVSDYAIDKCIQVISNGSIVTAADHVSMDADGFTINVTLANATARTIHYMAIGGDDVSADVGSFDSNTTTGNQAVTGVGFQPKAVLFVHGPKNTTGATITNRHQMGLGVGLSSTERWATYYIGTSNITTDEQSVQLTTRCIVSTSTALAIDEAADFVSNDTNGFTINWITKSATAFKIGYIALGGAAQYKAGSFLQPTATGNQGITGVGFQPLGELFVSQMKASGASPTAHSPQMLGAATSSTARQVSALYAQNGLDSSANPDALISTVLAIQTIAGAGTALSAADFVSQDSDGFTVNWTTVDATQREILYFTFGAVSLTAKTVSDTGVGTDTVTDITAGVSQADSGAGAEVLDILNSLGVSDTGIGSEALSLLVSLALAEAGSGSELVDILAPLAASDSGVGSDIVSVLGLFAVSDSGVGSEALSILATLALSDTGVGDEVIDIVAPLALSDSGLSSEALAVLAQIAQSDSGVASEAMSILANIAVSDTGAGSEVLAVLASIALSESGLGNEAVQILASVAVNEAGLAQEAVSILAQVAQGDTGAATEALSVLASLVVADTGVGGEILSILASFALSDAGFGSDALSILAEVAVSDSGLASEAISILAQVAISDSGLVADAVSILAQLSISDSAIATEVVNLFIDLIVNDAGLGSEAIDILFGFLISDSGAGSDLAGRLFSIDVSDSVTAKEVLTLVIQKLSQSGGSLSSKNANLYNRLTSALYNKGGALKSSGGSLYTEN